MPVWIFYVKQIPALSARTDIFAGYVPVVLWVFSSMVFVGYMLQRACKLHNLSDTAWDDDWGYSRCAENCVYHRNRFQSWRAGVFQIFGFFH